MSKRPIPAEFSDLTCWAAWLYFVDEMTQSEVAEAVGVSRVTVIKLLNDARQKGLVNVRFNATAAAGVGMSRDLASTFGLKTALVIPDNPNTPLVDRLGKAGASLMMDQLAPKDVIGVAWGRTVLAAARNLVLDTPIDDLTVVQVSASPTGLSADFSPELCVSLTASNLAARSVMLMAPAVVSSAELKAMLLQEPAIQRQMQVIGSANKVVFGMGTLNDEATLRISGLHSADVIDGLVQDGAVGAIVGRFIDIQGQEVPSPTDDRKIGMTLEELKGIPERLCLAGGQDKVDGILAALRGGYVTDLITDLPTAERLLEKAQTSGERPT